MDRNLFLINRPKVYTAANSFSSSSSITTVRRKRLLLSDTMPSSSGMPGPRTVFPSEADPRARRSSAGCPGVLVSVAVYLYINVKRVLVCSLLLISQWLMMVSVIVADVDRSIDERKP